jgi:hypothetical protein
MRRTLVTLLALALTGCGSGLYPVRGTVTSEDGQPITKGIVVFEGEEAGKAVTARGEIRPDGRYELSTYTPGDGVPPGHYRVLLNPLDLSDVSDEQKVLPFDIKYLKFETSGLEYEVKAGSNEFPIRVTRPQKARR